MTIIAVPLTVSMWWLSGWLYAKLERKRQYWTISPFAQCSYFHRSTRSILTSLMFTWSTVLMYVGRYVMIMVHNQKWLKNPEKMAQSGRHLTMALMGTDRLGELDWKKIFHQHGHWNRSSGTSPVRATPVLEIWAGVHCTCWAREDTMYSFSLVLMHGCCMGSS